MAKGIKTGGRKPGSTNKLTAELKDMILKALDGAGGVEYMQSVAASHPPAFLSLVGKVLPMTIANEDGKSFAVSVIERRIVKADN